MNFESVHGNILARLYGKPEYFNFELAHFLCELSQKYSSGEWFCHDWLENEPKLKTMIARVNDH